MKKKCPWSPLSHLRCHLLLHFPLIYKKSTSSNFLWIPTTSSQGMTQDLPLKKKLKKQAVLKRLFYPLSTNSKTLKLSFLFFCFSYILVFQNLKTQAAHDPIYINIGKAVVKKSLVAMPGLKIPSERKKFLHVKNIVEFTIQKNLNFTHYFKFIPASSFFEDPRTVSHFPLSIDRKAGFNFKKWAQIHSEFLIQGKVIRAGKNPKVELFLYYVPQEKLIFKKKYSNRKNQPSLIAHEFANDVLQKLTGQKSIFLTKIVMTSNRKGLKAKEIFTMNWDGSDLKQISYHKSSALSPAWSPGGNQIAYSAFTVDPRRGTRNVNLYVYDFRTRQRTIISSRRGINSGAVFFPNGRSLLMTLSATGTPDIYKIGLNGRTQGRVTSGPFRSMNVEPAVSPDGKMMAFSSDRSGRPMIYTMSLDPPRPSQRITIAGRYNAAPMFSPNGKKIAFAGWDKGHFDLFIMNVDGTNMQRLTQYRKPNGKWSSNEYPSFSPDGRYIVFQSNRNGYYQIFMTDTKGSFITPITVDKYNYFQPRWSPFLNKSH